MSAANGSKAPWNEIDSQLANYKWERIHFYQCNEHSNIINIGGRGKHIFTQCKQSPHKQCSDHECTNMAALWLEYKDMK